ncbi:MAG: putative metal-dependent hydrolase [Bacteroidetes bacterium]|nr:putative metal-dependent hydrolase [Bacteroidota bacterium]
MEQYSYPIGRFQASDQFQPEQVNNWLDSLEALPKWLEIIIENLDAAQLASPYREGGWSMEQVIHHLADTHMNAFIRCKLTITENLPTVKPYDEKLWAETPEISTVPVNVSITLLHALHRRWIALLQTFDEADWKRQYFHPESQQQVSLWQVIELYAWHSRHHMEQLRGLKERMGW